MGAAFVSSALGFDAQIILKQSRGDRRALETESKLKE